jgi:K+ transporter
MFHKKKLLTAYIILFGLYLVLYNIKPNDNPTTESIFINKNKDKPYIPKENKVEMNEYLNELTTKRRFGYKLRDNLNIILTPSPKNKDGSTNRGATIKLELLF